MGLWHFSHSRPTVEATLLITKHLKWFWSSQKAALIILNVGWLLWLPSAMQVLSHIHRGTFWISLCPHVPNSTEDRSHHKIVSSTPKSILTGNPLIIQKYNRGNSEYEVSCGHSQSRLDGRPFTIEGGQLGFRTLKVLRRAFPPPRVQ